MQALAGQFGMAVATVPPPPEGGWSDEIGAIQTKLLEITTRVGRLSGTAVDAMADRHIDSDEAKLMVEEANSLITMDGVTSLSRMKLADRAIRLALNAEQAASRIFETGNMAGGAIEVPNALSDVAYERMRTSLDTEYAGAAAAPGTTRTASRSMTRSAKTGRALASPPSGSAPRYAPSATKTWW
ncbi:MULTISPECIES: phage portal protein [unclassified Stenotrophomonas]|uniref:phage portal protein n=1 Tax=unclassified Stenotrophomonas TaxID=196198 RepID=UPI0020A6B702|nr:MULTISPECIES: phage portal protein [unclassified Stenotrophomonas]